jgi:hypothetical protein
MCGCVGVGVGGCVYKIEKFRTLSAPSEIASLREAISSSAAFELLLCIVEDMINEFESCLANLTFLCTV